MTRAKLVGVFDTETCNTEEGAYPVLYTYLDIKDTDLKTYRPSGVADMYRTSDNMMRRLDEEVAAGIAGDYVPVVMAYNLSFDLTSLYHELTERYKLSVNGRSSGSLYYLDCYQTDTGRRVLRFWDVAGLEKGGLRVMGEICGVDKEDGWDYNTKRTPDTPLTEEEVKYAVRDVEVIPAYLGYLLRNNEWMVQEDFATSFFTSTGMLRVMARRVLGGLKYKKQQDVYTQYRALCRDEEPKTYREYGLRKSAFCGGLSFTSATWAQKVVMGVLSVDVTSMHHTFINGRRIPVNFHTTAKSCEFIAEQMKIIRAMTPADILSDYAQPFRIAFHAKVKFKNIHIRKDSVFGQSGIGILSQSKFGNAAIEDNEVNTVAWESLQEYKWTAVFPTFAFAKLVEAQEATIVVNEVEFWCICQVYTWDDMRVLDGEQTGNWRRPPDYISLQSNWLYDAKNAVKRLVAGYSYGVPYEKAIPRGVPDYIQDGMRAGTLPEEELEYYYRSNIKGMFNSIYGSLCMDGYRPRLHTTETGVEIDDNSIATPDGFKPTDTATLYTYGERVAAGSRMHLLIAIELVTEVKGVRVLGGDTDSLKLWVHQDTENSEVMGALEPLAEASKAALDRAQQDIRWRYPDIASPLAGIGAFVIEHNGERAEYHTELWNKCRLSIYDGEHVEATLAGIPRPEGKPTVVKALEAWIRAGYDICDVLTTLTYDTTIQRELAYNLTHDEPDVTTKKDWGGFTEYPAIRLRSTTLVFGDTVNPAHRATKKYLGKKSHATEIGYVGGVYKLYDPATFTVIMEG